MMRARAVASGTHIPLAGRRRGISGKPRIGRSEVRDEDVQFSSYFVNGLKSEGEQGVS
jgi:hypothetical protein